MRISEIKQCISDDKVLQCVKRDFWDDEYYLPFLANAKGLTDIDGIFEVIRTAYLQTLTSQIPDDAQTAKMRRKRIGRLSKLIYGDIGYWAEGTAWEEAESEKKEHAKGNYRYHEIAFLHQRLGLKPMKKNNDVVYMIAHQRTFYDDVIKSEGTEGQINTRQDLYAHIEKVVLDLLQERRLFYLEYRLLRSASYLAFRDGDHFLMKHGLSLQQIMDGKPEE